MFGLCYFSHAQVMNADHKILELSPEELSKLGVSFKNKAVYYLNSNKNTGLLNLLIENGNEYTPRPKVDSNIRIQLHDFYPYYITRMDSFYGFLSWDSDRENEMKGDAMFRYKMQTTNLVPVKINTYDPKGKNNSLLFWFTPTESFCKALPPRYVITKRYIPDTLIKSDYAILASDKQLKDIGFVIDDEEMYLKTYMDDMYQSKIKDAYIVSWYNNKITYGTSLEMGGGVKNTIKQKDPKNKKYHMDKARYYIVKVVYPDGHINYETPSFKGRTIPIYIKNSDRNYKDKKDLIIYLKYTPELAQKLYQWLEKPDKYTVVF